MSTDPLTVTLEPFSYRASGSISGRSFLQQHPLYAKAITSFGADCQQLHVADGQDTILSGILLRRNFLRFVNVAMAFMGPAISAGTEPRQTERALTSLRKQFSPWRWRFLQLMPALEDVPENRQMMRRAGYSRIMSGVSTVWIDLRPGEQDLRQQLDPKWRNQLKKSEAEPITIAIGGAKAKHFNWLLERESEQRRSRGYSAVPLGLVPAYGAAGRHSDKGVPLVSVTASERGNKIAGALFLLHGTAATYHIGWSGDRGRDLNAQNRVLFTAFQALRERGIEWLDMGGIDTGPGSGIARFKLGLGQEPTTYVGTYLGK